jgi:WD40 repeat protein
MGWFVQILEHLINPKVPHEFMHTRTISAVAMVRSNQWRPGADKYVTFSKDGPINVWTGVQGMPQKQEHPFALRGAATFVLSAHALTMHNVVAVASNDERVRFYGFEPRFKLDLELLTVERRAMAMHSFAMKPGPDADWSSWFVWGDDCGSVHFIPENVLVSYRHGSIGLKVAEIKFEQMASEHGESIYSADLFTGWVTCMEYISEINGLHGALAIGSNDGNVVIFDSEERCVLFRYEGHSLAVKCLTWLRNYRSIASSGLDRDILLWDPLSGHKTGRLGGHKSPVINLCFYGQSDHLFSLDLRYQLYIWDAQKQLLVQQINTDDGDPFVTKNRFRAECIAINTFRGHIAICGKRPYVWKINEEEKTVTGAVIHQTQIITVIYNSLFNQIITAEVSGLVSVWEVISGRQSYFFRTKEQNKDGAPDDVSVAILDPLKRCLFVGFASGRIKSYNLHNGVATNEFFTAADVTKRTEYPIVGMLFSEKITADMGMGTPQDPHLFVSGLDATGAASVWIWATIHDHHTFELMPMKKMTLPSWRNDCFVDFTMSMDHQTGFLACGRVDGHVIVWNVQTGMVKRDVDHVFWFMDIDGDGSLTSEEVSTFLRSREGYTEQEVEEFMHRADYDKNSEISKLEFQLALERRGTVSKINPETGKLAKDRPGSSVVFTSFVKRIDDVIVTATADGFVMFSNYKKADLLHTFSAIPQPETPTAGHLHQEMLTGCLLDEREVTIFVTTNAGNTYVWDISLVTASSTLKQQLVKKIGGWKEADDELSCCEYLESQSVLLLAKAPRDPKMLPSVRLYHLDGTVAGSLGGDDPWMLCQDTQHAFLQRIKMGLGQKQKVVDDKVEDIRDFNFASMMKVETKSRKSFRQTNLVQQTGLLKGAAITMANRNAFRVKALRYKELQLRLQRARLFLEARMVNSVQIHKAILQDLEDVWREELEHMTLSDFEHNAGPKMNFGAVEETMLGEVDKEDRVLLLVRKFVLEELFKKKKGQYMLPPNDELTEEARTFVLSHYKKYQPHHAIHEFTPDSASTEDKEGDNTEYESNLMISDKEPWFHASVIKIFIISQVLSIKVASGDKDLLSYIDGDDLPINEQSRVFREQYGYSPHWDQDVSNEVRKRTSKVAAECKSILEKKDILAKKSETWLGRILSRDPENMPAPSVGIFETSHQTLLGNEVGSGHHHLIGPISHRRLSVRGPRGISEFEKTLPYPGEPASDHLGWSDLYVPKLNEPFKLKPSPNNLSAYRQRDLELSSSGQTGGDGSATAVELEGGEEKALDIVVKPHAHALKKNPKSSFSVQKMKREESGADISSITARLIVAFDNELEMPRHGTNSQESPGVRKAEPSSNEKPKGGGIITFKRRQQRFLDDGPVDADGISPERQSQRMIPKGSHFILRSPRSPSIPCTPSRATLPVRRTPRSTFSNSPRGKGDESKAAHESLVDLGFETPRQTSRWQTRSWDGETEKPPRLWTCKLRNVPLADEYLPAITKIAPTGVAHSRSSSGPSSRQPMPGDLAGSKTSVGTASLDSNLLLGVGESPETITWQLRRLSLEDQLIYVHIPHIDEHGRSCWEKKVLCHLQHDSDIEKVADDPGSVGRCGALLLSWGPNFQRLHLFIAGREAGVVLEWFLAVRNIIDFLVRHESHATQEKIHLYESKRVAKRTFRYDCCSHSSRSLYRPEVALSSVNSSCVLVVHARFSLTHTVCAG